MTTPLDWGDLPFCPCGCRRGKRPNGTAAGWHQRKGPMPILRPDQPWGRPDWVDHPYRLRRPDGSWVYIAEPYSVGREAFEDFIRLEDAGWDVGIQGWGAQHYPGSTLVVVVLAHGAPSWIMQESIDMAGPGRGETMNDDGHQVNSYDYRSLDSILVEYQAAMAAISGLLNAVDKADVPITWGEARTMAANMVDTAMYGDFCDNCARAVDADPYEPTRWPVAIDKEKPDWLKAHYHCHACGRVWSCGWAVDQPRFG